MNTPLILISLAILVVSIFGILLLTRRQRSGYDMFGSMEEEQKFPWGGVSIGIVICLAVLVSANYPLIRQWNTPIQTMATPTGSPEIKTFSPEVVATSPVVSSDQIKSVSDCERYHLLDYLERDPQHLVRQHVWDQVKDVCSDTGSYRELWIQRQAQLQLLKQHPLSSVLLPVPPSVAVSAQEPKAPFISEPEPVESTKKTNMEPKVPKVKPQINRNKVSAPSVAASAPGQQASSASVSLTPISEPIVVAPKAASVPALKASSPRLEKEEDLFSLTPER